MALRYEVPRALDRRETDAASYAPQRGSCPDPKADPRILLKADQNARAMLDKLIAQALEINPRTVLRVRHPYVLDGLEAALDHLRPQRFSPENHGGPGHISSHWPVAVRPRDSGTPPGPCVSWPARSWNPGRSLPVRMRRSGRVLKNILKPDRHEQFVSPPGHNGAFIAAKMFWISTPGAGFLIQRPVGIRRPSGLLQNPPEV